MSTDDLIYSPIFPEEELKRLVRRILSNPGDGMVIEDVSSDIVDLFRGVGITDQETIIDTVHRKRKKLASRWQPHLNLGTLPLLTMKADGSTRLSNNTINL